MKASWIRRYESLKEAISKYAKVYGWESWIKTEVDIEELK